MTIDTKQLLIGFAFVLLIAIVVILLTCPWGDKPAKPIKRVRFRQPIAEEIPLPPEQAAPSPPPPPPAPAQAAPPANPDDDERLMHRSALMRPTAAHGGSAFGGANTTSAVMMRSGAFEAPPVPSAELHGETSSVLHRHRSVRGQRAIA